MFFKCVIMVLVNWLLFNVGIVFGVIVEIYFLCVVGYKFKIVLIGKFVNVIFDLGFNNLLFLSFNVGKGEFNFNNVKLCLGLIFKIFVLIFFIIVFLLFRIM